MENQQGQVVVWGGCPGAWGQSLRIIVIIIIIIAANACLELTRCQASFQALILMSVILASLVLVLLSPFQR